MSFFKKPPPIYNKAISLGNFGEQYARWFLENKKYKIICINYQARYGEIDIICHDRDVLVFCEVKTRSSLLGGWPEEAVTKAKLNRLTTTCLFYIQDNKVNRPWRIDVVSILMKNNLVFDVKHYLNISSI